MKKCLVTGASGFIGGYLLSHAKNLNYQFIGLSTTLPESEAVIRCDLFDGNKLKAILKDFDCIVHCAGYAHAHNTFLSSHQSTHWHVNYEGTKVLLEAAAEAGVNQFIYMSSVKVMGNPGDFCVDETYAQEPQSAYGNSKLASENLINEMTHRGEIQGVNLRLAMVYGHAGRGNMSRMVNLVKKGIFPPIPQVNNHRSLIHISDVSAAINLVIGNQKAYGKTYILSGPYAPSGRDVYNSIRHVLGFKPIRLEIPKFFLATVAKLCSNIELFFRIKLPYNSEILGRLLDSEWYSSEKIESELGWKPCIQLDEGLREMIGDS